MLEMAGADPSDELHRHHVEVLARIRDQLQRATSVTKRSYDANRRSREASDRAEAARRRVKAALDRARASAVRVRLVGRDRDAAADERDRVADERDRIADERERAADEREWAADERDVRVEVQPPVPLSGEARARRRVPGRDQVASTIDETARLSSRAADMADQMAKAAEEYASYLENSARQGDGGPRLELARKERRVAEIARRNADRLRRPLSEHGPLGLEHLTGDDHEERGTALDRDA